MAEETASTRLLVPPAVALSRGFAARVVFEEFFIASLASLKSMQQTHCTLLRYVSWFVLLHSCLNRHQRWGDEAFFYRVSLKSLGLRIQLGHPLNALCLLPQPAKADQFVIIDSDGVHDVSLDFCGCPSAKTHATQLLRFSLFPATVQFPATAATFRSLNHFQMLSFEAKISVHDYYDGLVRQSDNTGMKSVPVRQFLAIGSALNTNSFQDREDKFRLMVREWRHLHLLKRAGRGHDLAGLEATALGSCAVLCPACPHPGINLPDDWMDAPECSR